jgi:hypothetical protein
MVSTRRFKHSATVAVAASALLFATAAFAGNPPKAAKASSQDQTTNTSDQILMDDLADSGRCAVASPSPTPQGVQQIHVCNNWTANAGAQVELFNTTGQSCTITAGSTTWPFQQAAPLTIGDESGLFVTLLSTLTGGGTVYNYSVSCCPPTPGMKTVTVP